jgi:hypothetical protein
MRDVRAEQHQVIRIERLDRIACESHADACLDPRELDLPVTMALAAEGVRLEAQESERTIRVPDQFLADFHGPLWPTQK